MNTCENNTVETKKENIDPMVFDTEESMGKKKETWNDIFLRCPDFADYIIKMYEDGGDLAITGLHDYLKLSFPEEEKE